jgi:hypothetical protein
LFTNSNAGARTVEATWGVFGAASGNYSVATSSLPATITPRPLTVTGLSATGKIYDATTAVTITGSASVSGVVSYDAPYWDGSYTSTSGQYADAAEAEFYCYDANGNANDWNDTQGCYLLSGGSSFDDVALGTRTANYTSATVGVSRPVTVTYALTGAAAGNYAVTPVGLTATVTPKPITVSGVSAQNKVYDRTTSATINGGSSFTGVIAADVANVQLGTAASFADNAVGVGKIVTIAPLLTGSMAANYILTQPATTANITQRPLTVSGLTAVSRAYNGGVAAGLSGDPQLNNLLGYSCDIRVPEGDAGSGECYDIVPMGYGYSYIGGECWGTKTCYDDDVALSTTTATFADAYVGNGKPVSIDFTLGGADAANYTVSSAASVANITYAPLSLTGIAAVARTYDGTNVVGLSGTPLLSGVAASDELTISGPTSVTVANKSVGNGKAVTVVGYSVSGPKVANYTLSQPTGLTVDITRKPLQILGLSGADKVYDGLVTGAVTGTGSLDSPIFGDEVSVDAGAASISFGSRFVGTDKPMFANGYRLVGADSANYLLTQPASLVGDITPLGLTISGVTAVDKVYDGDADGTLAGIGSETLLTPVSGDLVSLTGTPAATFADALAGQNKAVSVSGYSLTGTDNANYTLTQPSLTANITGRTAQVYDVVASDKVYDGSRTASLTGTPQLLGLVGADVVTVDAAGVLAQFDDATAGTGKSVVASGYLLAGAQAGNYTVVQPTGLSAAISRKPVTLGGLTIADLEYNGLTTATLVGTSALSGKVDGDDLSVGGTLSATFATKGVGTAKLVTVRGYTLAGTENANYSIDSTTALTGNILAKALTISGVSIPDKTYDQNAGVSTINGTATLVGTVSGDGVSVVTTGATASFADAAAGTNKDVTLVGYVLGGSDKANYLLSQPTGLKASILKRAVTVVGETAQDKTYDGSTTASLGLTGTLSGKLDGDAVSLDNSAVTATFASKGVGTDKPVTVSGYGLTGIHGANYSLSQPTGLVADITPLNVQVGGITIDDKVYDRSVTATIAGTADLQGEVGGDDVALVTSGAAAEFASATVGSGKSVSLSGYALSGTESGNYNLEQPSGLTAAITAKPVTITGISVQNRAYQSGVVTATIAGSPELLGVITPDAVTVGGTASATFADDAEGPDKAVTITGYTLGGANAANYSLTQPTGLTATITLRAVSIAGLSATTRSYDGTVDVGITGTASLVGIDGDDDVQVMGTPAGTMATSTVGIGKAVTVAGLSLFGLHAHLYSLVVPVLSVDITPAALTMTGVSVVAKEYDGTNSATLGGTPALAGKIGSDDVTPGVGVAHFANATIGLGKAVTVDSYTLGGAHAGNYSLTLPVGLTGNIGIKTVTVAGLSAASKIYDQTLVAAVSGTPDLVGEVSGDAVTLVCVPVGAFADYNVGVAKSVSITGCGLLGSAAGNYSLQQPTLSADITTRALTVTGISAVSRGYNTTTIAALSGSGSLNTVISGDVANLSGTAVGSFADKMVGSNKPVTVTGLTLIGAQAGNYSLTQPQGLSATISARGLAVSGIAIRDKVYDQELAAEITGSAALEAGGLLAGDVVNLVADGTQAVFATSNVEASKVITVTGYAIAGTDVANYSLTQPSTLTASITRKPLRVVNVTAEDKTYDRASLAALVGVAALDSVLSGDAVNLQVGSAVAHFADSLVGLDKSVTVTGYSITGNESGNYSLLQPAGLKADITTQTVQVASIGIANKTYDAVNTATITGTPTLNGVQSGDAVAVGGSPLATFSNVNAGADRPVVITGYALTGADKSNYTLVQPSGLSATINPKGVTVAGRSVVEKVYDGNNTATLTGTAVPSGVLNLQDVQIAGTSTALFDNENAGEGKAVTVTGYALSGTEASNYVLGSLTLTGKIARKSVGLSGLSGVDKIYDRSSAASLSGVPAIVTKVSGDDLSVGGTPVAHFADSLAGSAKPVTVTGYALAGADSANYTLLQPTGLTGAITKKLVTPSARTVLDKVYNNSNIATLGGTEELTGVISPDAVTLGGTATATFASATPGAGKTVTVTGYSLSGADASNYMLPAPLTLTGNILGKDIAINGYVSQNKVYDGNNTATLSGSPNIDAGLIVVGESVAASCATVATFNNALPANGKPITVTGCSLIGVHAANYSVIQPTVSPANITRRPVSMTGLSIASKVYDRTSAAVLSGTPTPVNGVDGELVGIGGTGSARFADSTAGTGRSVIVTGYTLTGADSAHYLLSQPVGLTANITRKALTVSGVSATNREYDATKLVTVAGGTLDGVLLPDDVTLQGAPSGEFLTKTVGNGKQVTVSGLSLAGADIANYSLSAVTGVTANVTAKPLVVVNAGVANKAYDRTTSATFTSRGLLNGVVYGDVVGVDSTLASAVFVTAVAGVGKATQISGYVVSGPDAVNYAFTQPSGLTANITAKAATVTGATVANKVYDGGTTASFGSKGTLSGNVSGDMLTLDSSAAVATFSSKTVGTGKATTVSGYVLGGADAVNYAFTQPSGLTANITAKPLSLSGTAVANKEYDGNAVATVTSVGTLTGVVAPDAVSILTGYSANFSDKSVGSGKTVAVSGLALTGADVGNYSLPTTQNTTANITARPLTIAGLTVPSRVYNGRDTVIFAGTATLPAKLVGDAVNLATTPVAHFANANVGSGKAVTFVANSLIGADSANYVLTLPTGLTGAVTPKSLSVTGLAVADRTYSGVMDLEATLAAGSPTVTGKVSGDDVNLGTPVLYYAIGNAGTGKAVTVASYPLTGLAAANYTVTLPTGLRGDIAKAPLTVTADDLTKAAGDGDPDFTASLTGLVGGDDATAVSGLTFSREAGEAEGEYLVTPADGTSANYELSYVGGTLTITPPTAIELAELGSGVRMSVVSGGVQVAGYRGQLSVVDARGRVAATLEITGDGWYALDLVPGNYWLKAGAAVTGTVLRQSF